MNNIGKKLAAVAFVALASLGGGTAVAGTGGSNKLITEAVHSGSTDAIIAEVERAEMLMCDECITTVVSLTEDDRFAVREVAAWWIAKRPGLADNMAHQFTADLGGDAVHVRNAADFLGAIRSYGALPALQTAMTRSDLTVEAKLSIVHAVGYMAHVKGNVTLSTAMGDSAPEVRAAAIRAWRDVLHQVDAGTAASYLTDKDARVRAEAATLVGAFATKGTVGTLAKLVTTDSDATVRRNAAWALGKIGDASATTALTAATADSSGLVRGVAKAALAQLH